MAARAATRGITGKGKARASLKAGVTATDGVATRARACDETGPSGKQSGDADGAPAIDGLQVAKRHDAWSRDRMQTFFDHLAATANVGVAAAAAGISPSWAYRRRRTDHAFRALWDGALGYRGAITHYVGMSHYFRLEALAPGCVTHLLAYLPSVLDPAAPEVRRANLPGGWARPAFDVLQLEDYDWVTAGDTGASREAAAVAEARLRGRTDGACSCAGRRPFPWRPARWSSWSRGATRASRPAPRGSAMRRTSAASRTCRGSTC